MKKAPLWMGAPARRPPQDAPEAAERPQRPRCTPPPALKPSRSPSVWSMIATRRGSDFYTRSTGSIFRPKRSRLFITCVVYISILESCSHLTRRNNTLCSCYKPPEDSFGAVLRLNTPQHSPLHGPSLPTSWHSLTIPKRVGFPPSFLSGYNGWKLQLTDDSNVYRQSLAKTRS